MSQVDDIEFYGRAAAAGDMTTDALVQATNGGLTPVGARDLIMNWQTARASYQTKANHAFHAIAALHNGRHPHPSTVTKEHR